MKDVDFLNTLRVALALSGLVFLFLAYFTHDFLFLAVAVMAFIAGFALMGAFRKHDESPAAKSLNALQNPEKEKEKGGKGSRSKGSR